MTEARATATCVCDWSEHWAGIAPEPVGFGAAGRLLALAGGLLATHSLHSLWRAVYRIGELSGLGLQKLPLHALSESHDVVQRSPCSPFFGLCRHTVCAPSVPLFGAVFRCARGDSASGWIDFEAAHVTDALVRASDVLCEDVG